MGNFTNLSNLTFDVNKYITELELITNILGFINFFFIVFGTFGNLISLGILMRKEVRKHSCMRYLATLCFLDILCLYTWNFSLVYSLFNKRKIEHEGPIICRFFSFFCYFILQSSSWIIVMIGMDRIITIVSKNSKKITKMAKNTRFVTFSVIFTFFCFNFIVLINNAEKYQKKFSNTTLLNHRTYTCYEPRSFYNIWDWIHILFYSIFPFFIILVENAFLSYLTFRHAKKMKKHSKNLSYPLSQKTLSIDIEINTKRLTLAEKINQRFDKKQRVYKKSVNIHAREPSKSKGEKKKKDLGVQAKSKKRLQNKTSHVANLLAFLTISFLFTTVPYSTFYALGLNFESNQNLKNIVIGILTILQYTRHSANFLIYLFTSTIIKREIKKIIDELKKKTFSKE